MLCQWSILDRRVNYSLHHATRIQLVIVRRLVTMEVIALQVVGVQIVLVGVVVAAVMNDGGN